MSSLHPSRIIRCSVRKAKSGNKDSCAASKGATRPEASSGKVWEEVNHGRTWIRPCVYVSEVYCGEAHLPELSLSIEASGIASNFLPTQSLKYLLGLTTVVAEPRNGLRVLRVRLQPHRVRRGLACSQRREDGK